MEETTAKLFVFLLTFTAILWEAVPFIILGAVIAGTLEELLPQEWLTRFLPNKVIPAVLVGGALGLIFPMCECGIVVVMRRLLRKGLPLSCCIAYMLAGPIVNVVVILSTWVAFRDHKIGPEMVLMRVGMGFVVACITGFVVHFQYRKYGNALLTATATPGRPHPKHEHATTEGPNPVITLGIGEEPVSTDRGHPINPKDPPRKKLMTRLSNISATALHDFVDITMFLILGAVLAAIAKMYVSPSQMAALSRDYPLLAIPLMMLLAVLMSLCSEADAFVAASFKTMHISAKLAFLVLGPMLDLKLLMMYTRVFRTRLIITIVACVVIQVLVYSFLVHLVYQMNHWSGMPGV